MLTLDAHPTNAPQKKCGEKVQQNLIDAYQNDRVPSALPVIACCSSSASANAHTRSSEVSYVATHVSDRIVQSFISPSAPVDSICIPEEQNWTRRTEASWPSNVLRHVSVNKHTSHCN